MHRGMLLLGLTACGRLGFDPTSNALAGDANGDGSGVIDAPPIDSVGGTDDSGVAAGCVTWDPMNRGNSVQIKSGALEATSNSGGIAVATYSLGSTTAQRAYLEIKIVEGDNNAEVAIKDGNFSNLNEYHVDINGKNVHYDNYDSELLAKGNGWTVKAPRNQSNFRSDDIVMWALDRAAGKIWYGRNGTWVSGGNPAAGTNESFNADITDPWFPSVYTVDGSRFVIAASSPDFMYSVPAGFISFSSAVGIGDADCVP